MLVSSIEKIYFIFSSPYAQFLLNALNISYITKVKLFTYYNKYPMGSIIIKFFPACYFIISVYNIPKNYFSSLSKFPKSYDYFNSNLLGLVNSPFINYYDSYDINLN